MITFVVYVLCTRNTAKTRITEIRLIRTVCFAPGGRKSLHYLKIQPGYYGHPIYTHNLYGLLRVRINGVGL